MNRPRWIYFDLESTGTDPHIDRVVEMCFVGGDPSRPGYATLLSTRVNPRRPIPAEASAVHRIRDEDVLELAPFGHHAERVQGIIEGAVLCGYNIRRFDSLLLDEELRRAGQPGLDRDENGRIVQLEVDLYGIWQRTEPRRLETAARRFAGQDLEDAHAADADTDVLPLILSGMRVEFDLPTSVDELAELSKPEGAIDRDGKFVRTEDGVVVFNFSKHAGEPVSGEPGMLEWMLGKDFSPETKAFARQFLEEARAGTIAGSGPDLFG